MTSNCDLPTPAYVGDLLVLTFEKLRDGPVVRQHHGGSQQQASEEGARPVLAHPVADEPGRVAPQLHRAVREQRATSAARRTDRPAHAAL